MHEESLLLAEPKLHLSEKPIESRLCTLPAEFFWRVLLGLLSLLQRPGRQIVLHLG